MKKQSLPLLAAIASSTIFAFAFFFTNRAQTAIAGDTLRLLGFRLPTAVLAMTAMWKLGLFKMSFKGKDLRPLIICGLLVPSLAFVCEFYALGQGWATSGQVAMFYALSPVGITTLGILWLKERPAPRQYLFMAMSVVGLVIVNWGISFETTHPLGILLPAIAVGCSCINSILLRKVAGQFAAIETVYVTTFVGAVIYLVLSVGQHLVTGNMGHFFDGVFTWPFISGIFYLAIVSSIFGFMMSNYMVAQLPPVVSSSFSGLSTILTIIVGVWLLGESIRLQDVAGCGLILAGALLMNAGYREPPVDVLIKDDTAEDADAPAERIAEPTPPAQNERSAANSD